jgi:predicted transcriptional regulator of viral defense system
MNQIDALRHLQQQASPVVESRDVAAMLRVSASNATTILRRLAQKQLIAQLNRGRWLVHTTIDRFAIPELISAPYPAYVSLQSALFHHGLVEQIPAVIYAVTLARPRRVDTPLGTVSYHRIPAELFLGFELHTRSDAKVATPEKALFDTLYLAPGRSRIFSKLPEVNIPRGFRWRELQDYLALVKSASRRSFIAARIDRLRADARASLQSR